MEHIQAGKEIIERWIESATERKMSKHLVIFWYLRDLLEGKENAKTQFSRIMMFLVNECKYSPERHTLEKAAHEVMTSVTFVDKHSETDTY